jgi:hypothetical protein
VATSLAAWAENGVVIAVENDIHSTRGLFAALVDDGRPLLKLTAIALIGSGLFAFFLAATGHFLPHDIAFLGMSADELRSISESRLVHFMIHDRVSFGGSILGVGTLYLWLAEFPLRRGEAWAWWTFFVSGTAGFLSFLAYLGYGYLDSWHGVATLVLLPVFLTGMYKSLVLVWPLPSIAVLLRRRAPSMDTSSYAIGRMLLLLTAGCLVLGGAIIMSVGMTTVFVPQDLEYMHTDAATLASVNPRLVPLIAHDRAGFGGGVCCCGITMFLCLLHSAPSRALWQAISITGLAGFGSAIGVHFPIGYMSFVHLAPAYLGAAMFVTGLGLTYPRMMR